MTWLPEKEKPTEYQIAILEEIINNSVKAMNYYHPEKVIISEGKKDKKKKLETITGDHSREDIQAAFYSLENTFHVVSLNNDSKYYEVNLEEAKKLYNSAK